ncbi:DJ-1/PfpI family protein [Dothidotthia symphoricarpi CBS 119687]|uniref:DJ-1/PfpI family protein n=1 Tax=Dothidotthia symphoricarpi CBS 119687 TaxID=1392245 RepID=A0A6A6AJN3_9PLEO|nr:DJ-1/PfpI family protein [Dothidotthia symphoricarpi CBS 119687]KAF2131087.1 DJ-1/PfpI family protein [Dothidotthia symphoricarpi CBS 119687]
MRVFNIHSLLAAIPSTLAIPPQPELSNTTTLPTHFAALVFPRYQAIDLFGPLDILNTISMFYGNESKMHMSIFSSTMDPVSTGLEGGFGEKILPTNTFDEVLGNSSRYLNDTKGEIDVLIVPGGAGTRGDMTLEVEFVKAVYPKLKYIISVCTGASILARAGILDDHRATTNKRSFAWVKSTGGSNVTWVPEARWVEDGNVFTSSGISAGIDVTYAWASHVYGEEVAEYLANSAEYTRWTNASYDPFAEIWGAQ